jgi:hypothetical protein
VTRDEALAFLQAHQPMPADSDLSEGLIAEYDEVRRYFQSHPDDRAPALLLNSFGEGSGFGVYQLVADALRAHDREIVIDALIQSFQSDTPSVRSWSLEIALEYADARLDPYVQALLASDSRDDRYFAAAYLVDRDVAVPSSSLAAAQSGDMDEELAAVLGELRVTD